MPSSGELRPNEKVLIVGAAGPMGQMHVIRSLCTPVEGISVVGADVDDARLEALRRKAEPYSRRNGVPLRLVNTAKEPLDERFSYQVVLVPAGAAGGGRRRQQRDRRPGGHICRDPGPYAPGDRPRHVYKRRCYMFGTSGSVISDMKVLLDKVSSGQLDTNCSVDAVSGMAGAIDGVAALEKQTMAGKIIIYPMLHDLGLTRLSELAERFPSVASKLDDGQWCKDAEQELLRAGAAGPAPAAHGGGANGDGAGRRTSVNGDHSRDAEAGQYCRGLPDRRPGVSTRATPSPPGTSSPRSRRTRPIST